jgi:hypothetical protein
MRANVNMRHLPSTVVFTTITALSLFAQDVAGYPANNIIYRDVAIIGGGGCGTHAAITFNDAGLSSVIVERSSILGGPAQTYTDPGSNTTIDYGVQAFQNVPTTVQYLKRVGVDVDDNSIPWGSYFNRTDYINFNTGKRLEGFQPSEDIWSTNVYENPLLQYPYLMWGKTLPSPTPSELHRPFAEFITKYSLESLAFGLNNVWGGRDILTAPTLNVIGDTGLVDIRNWQPGGSLRVVGGNNRVYQRALDIIPPQDILFNSTVESATRSTRGIKLFVRTPTGNKIIVAKKLLITIPTLAQDMEPFALDDEEHSVFESFSAASIWIAVIKIPGLPKGVSYVNAETNRSYNMTPVYGTFRLIPTAVDGLYTSYFNGDISTSDEQALAAAVDSVTSMVKAVTGVSALSDDKKPTIATFKRIQRWRPGMSADAIQKGTWEKMYALQGHRNTWYNGAMFMPASHQTWNYTETVLLPQILRGEQY